MEISLRRLLAMLLCLLLLGLAGCESSTGGGVGDGGGGGGDEDTGTIVFNTVLAKAVPSTVTQYRFTGTDNNGATVFGPGLSAKQPSITLVVPLNLVHLLVEYLDANGTVIGLVNVDVNVSNGQTVTITDPDFVSPTGNAVKVGFLTQPSNVGKNTAIAPPIQVTIEDVNGATVASSTAEVTLALGANPGNSTLGGTLTATAVNGVATFSDIKLDKAGTGYTLVASSTGLTDGTSNSFNVVNAGAPSKLAFQNQPANTSAGDTIGTVTVLIQDTNGLTTSSNASVSLAIGNNAGGGTLSGTLQVQASNGVATFSDLSISQPGTGYTLTASSGSLTGATSNAFDITGNSALALSFGAPTGFAIDGGQGGGSNPQQVATADLNGDGDIDIVVASESNKISIFPGNGDGTFDAEITRDTHPSGAICVATGDFNGDGNVDIACVTGSHLCLFPGDGLTFTFGTRNDTAVGTSLRGLTRLNVDNDNDNDLATLDTNNNDSLKLLVNDGTGAFTVQGYDSGGKFDNVRSLVSGDLNADGRPDIVVADFGVGSPGLTWMNSGTAANFFPSANLTKSLPASSATAASFSATIGNVDGDSDNDVVMSFTDGVNAKVRVYLNDGTGTFTAQGPVVCSGDPFGIGLADFDKDGFTDVVSNSAFGLNNNGTGEADIFLGNGDGSLDAQARFQGTNGDSTRGVAIGDFNEDTLPDLVLSGPGGGSILLNTSN